MAERTRVHRLRAAGALAGDVLVHAARRRVLWIYLALGALLPAVLVLGLEVEARVEARLDPGGYPAEVTLPGAPLRPGSVRVELGTLDLADDGAGALAPRRGEVGRGGVDYGSGTVRLDAGPPTASIRPELRASAAAGDLRSPAATAVRLRLFGQDLGAHPRPQLTPAEALATTLTTFLYYAVLWLASFVGVLLGVLAVASAVSSAFEPGQAELVLPRPLRRGEVVAARFAGALAFGAVQLTACCGLTVLLCGARHGVWLPGLLLAIPPILLKFALLTAIATLVGLLARTPVLGLGAAALTWLASFGVGHFRAGLARAGSEGTTIGAQVVWAQHLLPPVSWQDALALRWIGLPVAEADYPGFDPWVVSGQGLGWVVVALALAVLVVGRRDY